MNNKPVLIFRQIGIRVMRIEDLSDSCKKVSNAFLSLNKYMKVAKDKLPPFGGQQSGNV